MAGNQSKRSRSLDATPHRSRPRRNAQKPPQTPIPKKRKRYHPSGALIIPQVRGKVLDDLYLTMGTEGPCITLTFSDNTDVFFELDPGVKVTANYAAWKKGDQHMIKSWPQRRWFWQ